MGPRRTSLLPSISVIATSVALMGYGRSAYAAGEHVQVSGGDAGVSAEIDAGVRDIGAERPVTRIATVDEVAQAQAQADNDGNYFGTGDLTIEVGDVTRAGYGLNVYHYGVGDVSITGTGRIVGDTGIYAAKTGVGSITINTVDVAGLNETGIRAFHYADGDLTITSTGTVTGGPNGSAIVAGKRGPGDTEVLINTIDAADAAGISAFSYDAGDIRITATGSISSNLVGISAYTRNSGDIEIAVADVSSSQDIAIYATAAHGSGDITITSSGVINGYSSTGRGLLAYSIYSGEITLNLTDVEGGSVAAVNWGSDSTINISGAVNTRVLDLSAVSGSSIRDGSTSISVNTINSSGRAIYGYSENGSVTVTALGDINAGLGRLAYGISTRTGNGGAVSITTYGDLNASGPAITVRQSSLNDPAATPEDVTVTAHGSVYGGYEGISVSALGDVNVTVQDVTSRGFGVGVFHRGDGDALITSTGTITGSSGVLLYMDNQGLGTINVVDVQGGDNLSAVRAQGSGGRIEVVATGDIVSSHSGVTALNSAMDYTFESIDITVNNVTVTGNGGTFFPAFLGVGVTTSSRNFYGERTLADATGRVSVTVTGAVTAPNIAIHNNILNAIESTITVTETGSLNSPDGLSILDGNSDTRVMMRGAILSGDVDLGEGDDQFTLSGAQAMIADGVALDGGAGSDTLVFDNARGVLSGAFTRFETTRLQAGSVVELDGHGFVTDLLAIENGAVLTMDRSATVTGTVNNEGLISLADGQAGDTLTVNGDFGGGALLLDLDLTGAPASDRLVVTGSAGVSGPTELRFSMAPSGSAHAGLDTQITLVSAGAGVSADDFVLAGEPVESGALDFDIGLSSAAALVLSPSGISRSGLGYSGLGLALEQAVFGVSPGHGLMAAGRTADTGEARPWVEAFSSNTRRDAAIAAGTLSTSAGYDIDMEGFRGGVDLPFRSFLPGDAALRFALGTTRGELAALDAGGTQIAGADIESTSLMLGFDQVINGYSFSATAAFSHSELDLLSASGAWASTDATSRQIALMGRRTWSIAGEAMMSLDGGVVHQTADVDTFADSEGVSVSFADQTTNFIPVGLGISAPLGDSGLTVSGRIGLEHEFTSDHAVTVGGIELDADLDGGTRAVSSLGLQWRGLGGRASIQANVDYQEATSGGGDRAFRAGIRAGMAF